MNRPQTRVEFFAPDKPRVGDLASFGYGGDSYPYTVIAVSPSGHKVTLQERKARRVDNNGLSEDQRYITVENPKGGIMEFTRRKDGRYRPAGANFRNCPSVRFGQAIKYLDPSF